MVYLKDDFYSKIVSNQKNGRTSEVKKQLLNEIADLVVNYKADVIEALNASGVDVNEKASNKKVVGSLVKNLPSNKKLQAGIGYLIVSKKTQEKSVGEDGSTSNVDDFISTLLSQPSKQVGDMQSVNPNNTIKSIISRVSDTLKTVITDEQDQKQLEAMVEDKDGGSKSNKTMYVVGLVVVVAVVAYLVINRKKVQV